MAQPSVSCSKLTVGSALPGPPIWQPCLTGHGPCSLLTPAPGMVFVVNSVLAWLMFSIDVRNAMLR